MTNQEAIDIFKCLAYHNLRPSEEEIDDAIKALEQEPKTGHREYNDIYDHYLCGNCKTVVMDYDNYCPNCGCRMVEPQESEE